MKLQKRALLFLIPIGLASLGGCEAPQGGRYNNAAYNAPHYDANVYVPKYTVQPFYNHRYYHQDVYLEHMYS